MTDDARKLDFLEGGGTLEYAPRAPAADAAAIERARLLRAQQTVRDTAARTSAINTAYRVERREADRYAVAESNLSAAAPEMLKGTGAWNFAGQDWGLLPAAAKTISFAVALAATGGLAAPSVALEWKKIKDTVKGNVDFSSAGKARATVQTAFKVADVAGDKIGAAYAAADHLLSVDARDVIANTQALAMAGDVDAQRGAVILAKMASARLADGVGIGQSSLKLTPEQVAQIAAALGGNVAVADRVSDVRQSWWRRIIEWISHEIHS